jgi:hypothetical protein
MIKPLTVTLSPDMVLEVFKNQLKDAIEVSQQEINHPDCHPDDAKECSNIIEAAQYLLGIYFMPEEL